MKERIIRIAGNPVPTNRPVEADQAVGVSGQVDTTSSDESSTPALPNERDEKVGMTGGVQSARVQQGARDLKRGLQDTSRAIEADAAYKKQKR